IAHGFQPDSCSIRAHTRNGSRPYLTAHFFASATRASLVLRSIAILHRHPVADFFRPALEGLRKLLIGRGKDCNVALPVPHVHHEIDLYHVFRNSRPTKEFAPAGWYCRGCAARNSACRPSAKTPDS